jgi:hypothetical protein
MNMFIVDVLIFRWRFLALANPPHQPLGHLAIVESFYISYIFPNCPFLAWSGLSGVRSHSSGNDSFRFILRNNSKLSSFMQVKNQRFLSFNA